MHPPNLLNDGWPTDLRADQYAAPGGAVRPILLRRGGACFHGDINVGSQRIGYVTDTFRSAHKLV